MNKKPPICFPKSTPMWIQVEIKNLDRQVENLEKKYERVMNQLGKTQEDFQDLLDLVERIAEDRESQVRLECQKMIERFNLGSYPQEESS